MNQQFSRLFFPADVKELNGYRKKYIKSVPYCVFTGDVSVGVAFMQVVMITGNSYSAP